MKCVLILLNCTVTHTDNLPVTAKLALALGKSFCHETASVHAVVDLERSRSSGSLFPGLSQCLGDYVVFIGAVIP